MSKEIVVSGVRPTGSLHIGNYFGAVKNFVQMQDQFEQCYFFVADFHALTTHPAAADLQKNVEETVMMYLACGLDPEKVCLYVQSHLPEIPELYLLINMLAQKSELERATTYKDKVAKHSNNINAGLLTYPVLMAVDIIIHKATKVPVGKDQQQHLEMTRTFANRFNHMYNCDYFEEPQAFTYADELVKVPALDGSGKMSKSGTEKSCLFLSDNAKTLEKKVKRAVTDEGPQAENSAKPEIIQNLFDLMHLVSSTETIQAFDSAWNDTSIRYGDLKKQLASDMVTYFAPIQERMAELQAQPKLVTDIIEHGANEARKSSAQTLKDVREIMGLGKRP